MTRGQRLLAEYQARSRRKQYELADYLGLTKAYLSQILSGKRRPGLPTATRIEELTGVPSASWLETEVGESARRIASSVS